jgi:3'(2'), 5'-bisphosphate nucleotidase
LTTKDVFHISDEWATQLYELCLGAGEILKQFYLSDQDVAVSRKSDNSPITEADLAANDFIINGLNRITPRLPIVSEEMEAIQFVDPSSGRYWLIDPLDGTREFIEKTGEFTINIGLIEADKAIFGVIYAPMKDCFYIGGRNVMPFMLVNGKKTTLKCRPLQSEIVAAISRRRARGAMDFLAQSSLVQQFGVGTVTLGSALKLTHIARGEADIYPCLGPTGEWDTAAGQAIVEAAGGAVVDLQGRPLRYGLSPDRINPSFVVIGDIGAWRRAGDIGS